MSDKTSRFMEYEEILSVINPCNFLFGKHILFTGGTGFTFRYFIEFLCWLNAQFHLNLRFSVTCRKNSIKIDATHTHGNKIHWLEDDLDHITSNGYDIIVHAASPANRKQIEKCKYDLIYTNVVATHHLLQLARQAQSQFLYVSSGAIYPSYQKPISESALTPGYMSKDQYGICKRMGEMLCEQYAHAFSINTKIIRPFSIFSPGERVDSGRFLVEFIAKAVRNEPIRLNSSGNQLRSYCYITDYISAVLYVLQDKTESIFNIGNEDNIMSIRDCAERIDFLTSQSGILCPELVGQDIPDPDVYIPDTTRLRSLGWKPVVGMDSCLSRLLDFYRERLL